MKPLRLKPLVYLASPYTQGDKELNVEHQIRLWHELTDTGLVTPFAPLLSHYLDPNTELLSYDDWMRHSLEVVSRMDAVYRSASVVGSYVQTYSPGANREILYASMTGKPVFYERHVLLEWAKLFGGPVPTIEEAVKNETIAGTPTTCDQLWRDPREPARLGVVGRDSTDGPARFLGLP